MIYEHLGGIWTFRWYLININTNFIKIIRFEKNKFHSYLRFQRSTIIFTIIKKSNKLKKKNFFYASCTEIMARGTVKKVNKD